MNSSYRIVWSRVRNAWIVASELAKGYCAGVQKGRAVQSRDEHPGTLSAISSAVFLVLSLAGAVYPLVAQAGIIGNNTTVEGSNSSLTNSFDNQGLGGGYTTASMNGVALVGASDTCGMINPLTASSVYGTGSTYSGGLYGFGQQTTATTWSVPANAGAGQPTGINDFTTAQTFWIRRSEPGAPTLTTPAAELVPAYVPKV